MKKLFLALTLLFGMGSFGFAQDYVAKAEGKQELVRSKKTGMYKFIMPSDVTDDVVTKNKGFYTQYFTVEFDESSHTATINVVNDDDIATKVIGRFLMSCGVREVQIGEESISAPDFVDKHL